MTDTSERGLERLICTALTGSPCDAPLSPTDLEGEAAPSSGAGWICGAPNDYDREYTVDLAQLLTFLVETQQDAFEGLRLEDDGPGRRKFLARLQGETSRRGVIDVLRKGVKDGPYHVELFYGTPSPGNPAAEERYAQNHFSVTRQLRYSRDETQRALDLGLFINGLPIATFELKNSLTKQTVEDAVEQYKRDRSPREKLFEFGPLRCALRGGRPRGAVLHAPQGQDLVVPALQPGLERWRWKPAESERPQDRLSLEADFNSRRVDQHPGELRADRRD